MTKQELKHYLLTTSALDLAEDDIPDNILDVFVNKEIKIYGTYRPLNLRERVNINSFSYYFKNDLKGREVTNIKALYMLNPELSNYESLQINFKYDKQTGLLYVQIPNDYLIDYLAIPLLEDITYKDTHFLNLILGRYLMYIGSRRAQFNIDSLPFTNNGSELVSQGQEIYSATLESLANNGQKWYESIIL